jgi:hypothetical protein
LSDPNDLAAAPDEREFAEYALCRATAAGQCLGVFHVCLSALEVPEFVAAAKGDEAATAMLEGRGSLMGIASASINLIVSAMRQSLDDAGGDIDLVTPMHLLSSVLPQLADTYYPGADTNQVIDAFVAVRQLEYYLVSRVNGDEVTPPADASRLALFQAAQAAIPFKGIAGSEGEILWVNNVLIGWLDGQLRRAQGRVEQ